MPRITSIFLMLLLLLPAALPARGQSLFSDPKARLVGDIVTVILAERTAASRESQWGDRGSASAGGSATLAGAPPLSGRFAADAQFNHEARSRNESFQRDLLTGQITAQVVERDATGNLLIAGERRLSINGETHIMHITGVVRPFDIRHDNTVLSFQIAGANIDYTRNYLARRWLKPAWLARVGLAALVTGAIIFTATN